MTPPAGQPPAEQPSGPEFCNPGCTPEGGPSAKLMEWCGLTDAAKLAWEADNAAEMATVREERAVAAEARAKAAKDRAARDAAAAEAAKARARADESKKRAEQLRGEAPTAPATNTAKGHANSELTALALKIFHFFFPLASTEREGEPSDNVLQVIVEATNAKAAELVVKEQSRGAFRCATEADDSSDCFNVKPGPHARYRCPDLVEHPLTESELLVFLGAHMLLGVRNNDVLDHAWSTSVDRDLLRVPLVANSIREDRYKSILSHLSFMLGDDERWLDDPHHSRMRKLKPVNDPLRRACQEAWDIEKEGVIDESRLRMSSRYCSLATTLLCKPIKHGLTIYCVNFCRTRYLYNFAWFTGKAEAHGAGQPTDTTPLDEDDEESYGYILHLLLNEDDGLITSDFNDTGCCWYLDKAFTSFRLARALAKRRNAIVGMLRTAGRPKNTPRGATEYWPFRGMSKADLDEYVRGFRREAYTKVCTDAIEKGDIEWIRAELWRDSKWVTLLATTFHSASDTEVSVPVTVSLSPVAR